MVKTQQCPNCEATKQEHADRLLAMHASLADAEAKCDAAKQELSDFKQEVSDALQIAREALEGMVRYSGMRESWQDDNPQHVEAARDAIDVIDAALQEQSK